MHSLDIGREGSLSILALPCLPPAENNKGPKLPGLRINCPSISLRSPVTVSLTVFSHSGLSIAVCDIALRVLLTLVAMHSRFEEIHSCSAMT